MRAAILAVGSELLGADRLDTNSLRLAAALEAHGVELALKLVVGDDEGRIAAALEQLLACADLILVTGGLGPTLDDLTRFWRALIGGELLAPEALAEMQTTVAAVGLEEVIPGVQYGLGIMSVPTSCGGLYWSHFGDTTGFTTRNAVNPEGTRAVVLSNNTSFDVGPVLDVIGDDLELLDDVMCAP